MKGNAAVKLEVGGHTDSDGDAARNQSLSQARAEAVRKVLVDQSKANNRRVEFTKVE